MSVEATTDGVTLDDLLGELRQHRWWLFTWTIVPALMAIVYSVLAAPVYRATVLVKVAKDPIGNLETGAGRSQLSGLASLAGFRLGESDETAEALAILKSDNLARLFIKEQALKRLLFPDKWDAAGEKWLTENPDGPSENRTAKRFRESVRRIAQDEVTGLVKVEMRARDPEQAAAWANKYVALANRVVAARKIDEAQGILSYLQQEIEKTDNVQLREVVARLMQTQINNATLAQVRDDYAFRVLDPALAPDPDDFIWPRPALITVVTAVLGLIAGLVTARFRSKRQASDPKS